MMESNKAQSGVYLFATAHHGVVEFTFDGFEEFCNDMDLDFDSVTETDPQFFLHSLSTLDSDEAVLASFDSYSMDVYDRIKSEYGITIY